MRDAADALAVAYSTYAGHENGSRDYDPDDAELYARRFKVDVGWLLTGKRVAPLSPDAASPRIAMIPISGIVRAGVWQEVDVGDSGLYQYVPADLKNPPEWQFAYTVEGSSLDKIANPGDVLICLDLIKSRTDLADNDLVIVERSRFGGQMVDRTAKRVKRVRTGFELWPESNDPAHQEPIIINGGEADDEEVRVTAKVLWIMKKP